MRAPSPGQGGYRAERIAIRRAELTLEVEDVAKAAAAAAQVAEARGGFAENQTVTDERTGCARCGGASRGRGTAR